MKQRKSQAREELHAPRAVPALSPVLPEAENAVELFQEREITVRELSITDLKLEGLLDKRLRIEDCVLTRVNFSKSNFSGLKLKDVRLLECDFANANAAAMVALRVEFVNCRLTGFQLMNPTCSTRSSPVATQVIPSFASPGSNQRTWKDAILLTPTFMALIFALP